MPEEELHLIRTLLSATPQTSTIYHYTTQDGLLGIIKEKALWLSNVRYLNDAAEYEYQVEILRNKLNSKLRAENGPWNQYYGRVLELLDTVQYMQVFVGSFSERSDLLSWA